MNALRLNKSLLTLARISRLQPLRAVRWVVELGAPSDTPMIRNRHLPLWLHRVCNGVFGAVLLIGLGSIWFGAPAESWRHIISRCLIWAGIPVGIVLALIARRFSIVQGVAGRDGYDELHEKDDKKPLA